MSDPRMKAVLYELAEKKEWQRCLGEDVYDLVRRRFREDYLDYSNMLRHVINGWVKHPFDVVEIPLRAAEEFAKKRGYPLLFVPVKYVEAAVELMCTEVNARFRMTLVDHGLERMDLVLPGDVRLRQQELCREYRELCGVVSRRWEEMRHPHSVFESAATVFVDLQYDVEAKFPDMKELFARFTAPFFGEAVGRMIFSIGNFIVDTTHNMREGNKWERMAEAEGKNMFFGCDAMRLFDERWEKRVQAAPPAFLREMFALRWSELTGEEMPVEFMTVM